MFLYRHIYGYIKQPYLKTYIAEKELPYFEKRKGWPLQTPAERHQQQCISYFKN